MVDHNSLILLGKLPIRETLIELLQRLLTKIVGLEPHVNIPTRGEDAVLNAGVNP
jgi:hypothetical protein